MFEKFNFGPGEIVHLKDFARKAIKEAIAHDSVALCTANIDRMKLNYREVVESAEGIAAIEAMDKALAALMAGRRNQSQVENYIARDVIGCKPEELEGRK